ncbi:hypothetical protein GOV14_02645 [Candidatus Pacearchaeota archaeon]|nr:hypothetical protein [Candidatus Pacearchaeota archaeon]
MFYKCFVRRKMRIFYNNLYIIDRFSKKMDRDFHKKCEQERIDYINRQIEGMEISDQQSYFVGYLGCMSEQSLTDSAKFTLSLCGMDLAGKPKLAQYLIDKTEEVGLKQEHSQLVAALKHGQELNKEMAGVYKELEKISGTEGC